MFSSPLKTNYPPLDQPMMVWDGNCGFCHYWIIKWNLITKDIIKYKKYQLVHQQYADISIEQFKQAVQLIMPDGQIYSGPAAAYQSFALANRYNFLIQWYQKSKLFRNISNWAYQKVAENRYELYNLSKKLFGKNPRRPRYNWLVYLILMVLILITIIKLIFLIQ